jgi:Uma2 family endonuclease
MSLPRLVLTPAEYLAGERASAQKSEYFRGEIFAMAGGSPRHNRIIANLIREVDSQLVDGPCFTYPSDQRVRIPETGLYTYPDVSVVCGEPIFEEGDTLVNPILLVEVLSENTEGYDRGAKWAHYRRLPSLREYVLVSQDRPRIERYVRHEGGWEFTEECGLDAEVQLASVPARLSLSRVYNRVDLPSNPGR